MLVKQSIRGGRERRAAVGLAAILLLTAAGCSKKSVQASSTDSPAAVLQTVGVVAVAVKPIGRQLTVSSELVPFQNIDVYAKESGYVTDLRVDYGTRVKKGQLMAVLEIPELEKTLAQDEAAIRRATDQVTLAEHEVSSRKAQHQMLELRYTRLKGVSDTQKGLVAQQEVDDAEDRNLAAEAQVEAGESALLAARSRLDEAKAKQQEDQVLFDYSHITAPFDGVVTQRYANMGTLMQAGTSSSTQALPLVKLAEDDVFRLVIPVPESYVKFIKVGDPVRVSVPSLNKLFPGRVTRFSVDVAQDTRTMHTEVDVQNPHRELIAGMYAEASLTLDRRSNALVVPLQAINQSGSDTTIYLVDPNNRVQVRKIKLGVQTDTDAEVLNGLNEGDRVVVSDRGSLKVGMEVKPQTVDLVQAPSSTDEQQ